MNKKAVLTVFLIVVAVAVAYFFFAKRPAVAPSPTSSDEVSSNTSLKDLLSSGIAQSCTFNNDRGSGTIYVSGSNLRGDFNTTVDGQTQKSHMIVAEGSSYSWSDGETIGVKMDFDPSATSSESAAGGGLINTNVNMDYKCGVWIVDSSLFRPPEGIQFSSITASKQCSYCDSLSGNDKTQCLTALKCN